MLDVSKELEAQSGGNYEERKLVVYFATLAVTTTKRVVYCQRPPGFGKTFENILIAMYVAKHTNMKPIYVVLNPGLQR